MRFLSKGTKAYGIFNLKCPKCHEGNQFPTPTFSFRKSFDMHDNCPHCGQNFMPEPGFYYGAMFLSYIFMAWFCIGFVAFVHWVLGLSTGVSFALLIGVCAIFFVYIFRFARSLWLNMNFKYDPEQSRSDL